MSIRKIFESMKPGTQALFLAEDVAGFNDLEMSLEAVSLVRKGKVERGMIVRKGEWPFTWDTAVVSKVEEAGGVRMFFTKGTRTNDGFFKSCVFNLRRKGHKPSQKSWQVVENVPPATADDPLHKIYKAIEVSV